MPGLSIVDSELLGLPRHDVRSATKRIANIHDPERRILRPRVSTQLHTSANGQTTPPGQRSSLSSGQRNAGGYGLKTFTVRPVSTSMPSLLPSQPPPVARAWMGVTVSSQAPLN